MAYEVNILKGAVSKNHVHLMVSTPPTMSPSKLAPLLKGRSSFKIQQEFPELKKRYWGQHIWARGFFCASVGSVTDEMIRDYIARHKDKKEDDDFVVE